MTPLWLCTGILGRETVAQVAGRVIHWLSGLEQFHLHLSKCPWARHWTQSCLVQVAACYSNLCCNGRISKLRMNKVSIIINIVVKPRRRFLWLPQQVKGRNLRSRVVVFGMSSSRIRVCEHGIRSPMDKREFQDLHIKISQIQMKIPKNSWRPICYCHFFKFLTEIAPKLQTLLKRSLNTKQHFYSK